MLWCVNILERVDSIVRVTLISLSVISLFCDICFPFFLPVYMVNKDEYKWLQALGNLQLSGWRCKQSVKVVCILGAISNPFNITILCARARVTCVCMSYVCLCVQSGCTASCTANRLHLSRPSTEVVTLTATSARQCVMTSRLMWRSFALSHYVHSWNMCWRLPVVRRKTCSLCWQRYAKSLEVHKFHNKKSKLSIVAGKLYVENEVWAGEWKP